MQFLRRDRIGEPEATICMHREVKRQPEITASVLSGELPEAQSAVGMCMVYPEARYADLTTGNKPLSCFSYKSLREWFLLVVADFLARNTLINQLYIQR